MALKSLKIISKINEIKLIITFVIGSVFIFIQCEKEKAPSDIPIVNVPALENLDSNLVELSVDSCVLIPLGQLVHKGNSVDIFVGGSKLRYDTLDDGLGGFWAVIPNSAFENGAISELIIKITRRAGSQKLFSLKNDTTKAYLKNSMLINWDTYAIKNLAKQLNDEGKTNTENALVIQEYVRSYLTFDESYSNYFGGFSAYQTYLDKKGVCINFSRLFIALCRAAGIPSRSVSGVVFQVGDIGTDCFFHHQWCEFLDENKHWRSIDLTYTADIDITNLNYIDFTYCAEETEIFSDYYSEFMNDPGKVFKTKNECTVVYCYLPTERGARFDFQLIQDCSPDSIVFEKSINVLKSYNTVWIK